MSNIKVFVVKAECHMISPTNMTDCIDPYVTHMDLKGKVEGLFFSFFFFCKENNEALRQSFY